MGKTYEALKKAEQDRHAQSPREAEPAATTGAGLPTPVERNWFRFARRWQRRTTSNGHGYDGNGPGNGNGNGTSPFAYSGSPLIAEEFHRLRKNLLATRTARPLQLMLVVSSRHAEGATTTTALLGLTMAKGGRCLLVDANFRTPGLTRILGGTDAPGVCEALADDPAARRIHYMPTDIPNLYLMPTGKGPARVPYLFEGRPFDEMLAAVRRDFDVILIDGAPMEMYADSAYVAPRADGVLLIVKAETTPLDAPSVSLRELERAGAHVLGAVLNRTQNYIPDFLERLSNPQEVLEIAVLNGSGNGNGNGPGSGPSGEEQR